MVSDMKKIEAMARAWCRSIHVNPDKWDEKNDCHEWVNAMPAGVGLLKCEIAPNIDSTQN